MLYFKIPNALKINAFLKKQKKLALTYEPVRGTQMGSIRDYDNDFIRVTIGKGRADFEAAKAKMRAWQMFPPTWTKIMPENAPIKLNTNVAMFARFGGLWWRNACRIVFITDIPRRFGFAYGTLPSHMEYGEEFFLVEWKKDDSVEYSIRAFSSPRHILARVAYPIMRLLQAKFRRDSIQEMMNDE